MRDTNIIEYEHLGELNGPYQQDLIKAFKKVLKSGWFILGKEVENFEKNFASFHQSNYCIGVANGMDALIIALRTLNLPAKSEVIVPSNTYIASILAILHAGLTPVLVEPDIKTYNIDNLLIEEKITKSTRAILVVHLYGKICQMDSIIFLASKYNLKIIEDCAQAHGAKFNNQLAGTFGDLSGFSFYPTKNLGAIGDAGCILTNQRELADRARMFRNYGSEKKYYNEVLGYNSRLDELQAALLIVKLKYLDYITNHKRILAKIYLENLKQDFIKPLEHDDFYDVYHIFNIRTTKRDQLKEYLLKNNIKTEIHYPISPVKQNALKTFFKNEQTPISDHIHATTLSLPVSIIHSTDDIYRVIEVMNRF
jgi:dTDP-4-amino-4,6-dideoxygalactose transaminase